MKVFDSIIFDLDGTLWDTCAACAIAWNTVLERNGIAFRIIVEDDVRRVTGKPHEICIRETFMGLAEENLQVLIAETMIEDNLAIERFSGELYPNVVQGLKALSQRYRLFIVSNCQAGYIERFLEQASLDDVFEDHECWGNTRHDKAKNVASVIKRNRLQHAVMVGDMESDLAAARECGIPFFHVRYGFGRVESFERAFDSFDELVGFLSES